MKNKKNKIGIQFCNDLYDVLVYAIMKLLNDEENHFKKEIFDYSELIDHFEEVADRFVALKRLCDAYDELLPELVGFAITQDIEDFDVEFTLDTDELISLRDKIDEQIKKNIELYGKSSSVEN